MPTFKSHEIFCMKFHIDLDLQPLLKILKLSAHGACSPRDGRGQRWERPLPPHRPEPAGSRRSPPSLSPLTGPTSLTYTPAGPVDIRVWFFFSSLFMCLACQVFTAACGIFHFSTQTQLRQVEHSSLTRDRTWAPFSGNMESQPLDHQRSPEI